VLDMCVRYVENRCPSAKEALKLTGADEKTRLLGDQLTVDDRTGLFLARIRSDLSETDGALVSVVARSQCAY